MGTRHWAGLLEWLREVLLKRKMISPEDMDLFLLTDDPEQAVAFIQKNVKDREVPPRAARIQPDGTFPPM